MGRVVTKDNNRRYNEARAEMDRVRHGPTVRIGFRGPEGLAKHPGSPDVTIVEVATFNEFGTSNIPERSFIRSTMDENRNALLQTNKQLFFEIVVGSMTTERALNILGMKMKALIQKKITDLRTPPNAPSTIRQKGSSNPLIDTGTMRQAVTYKVSMTGGDEAA